MPLNETISTIDRATYTADRLIDVFENIIYVITKVHGFIVSMGLKENEAYAIFGIIGLVALIFALKFIGVISKIMIVVLIMFVVLSVLGIV